jgi:hypothetical protein
VLELEQRHLLGVFLSCRGVIRDMEKVLGLSYPTVRSRIDDLLSALGYGAAAPEAPSAEDRGPRQRAILDRLEAGEISPQEAAAALKSAPDGSPE